MATTLNELINRMNAYTPIRNIDETFKVNAIDSAIRMFRSYNNPPWMQKKTTLRIFMNQFLYPVASDHAQLAMLDDPLGQDVTFGEHPRYIYTNLRDFLETPEPRNLVGEIWQDATLFLGVRNYTEPGLTQQLCDSAQDAAYWAGSGDAGTPTTNDVIFITGPNSIAVPITNSSGTATITNTFQFQVSNQQWQRNYFFVSVFISSSAAPTSIQIRLKDDNSNYLDSPVMTTQFAGQSLVANDWNTIAFDLDTATVTGTITGDFNSAVYTIQETASGVYYFDQTYLKGWVLQDYWYYSKNNVQNADGTFQQVFAPDSATYDLTAVLLGDTSWHDTIVYEADLYLLADQKEESIYNRVESYRARAWEKFFRLYPDNTPQITTNVYRFQTEYCNDTGYNNYWGY